MKVVATKEAGVGAGFVLVVLLMAMILVGIASSGSGKYYGQTHRYNNYNSYNNSYNNFGKRANTDDNNAVWVLIVPVCIGSFFILVAAGRYSSMPDVLVAYNENNELILPEREPLPMSEVKDISFRFNRGRYTTYSYGTLIIQTAEEDIKLYYVSDLERVVKELLELKYKVNSEIKE